jgi:hypothetical protein
MHTNSEHHHEIIREKERYGALHCWHSYSRADRKGMLRPRLDRKYIVASVGYKFSKQQKLKSGDANS